MNTAAYYVTGVWLFLRGFARLVGSTNLYREKADMAEQTDEIAYLSIDEWKREYGEPGDGGCDIFGRICGTFPTEPDFCEQAIGSEGR